MSGVLPDNDSRHVVAVEYRRDDMRSQRHTHTVRLEIGADK